MKKIILIILILLMVGCKKDEDIIPYKLSLDNTYKSSDSTLYLSSDGTFTLTECIKEKCSEYNGVNDHTDNGIDFYFEYEKENDKWIKNDKIINAKIIDDYTIELNKQVYHLVK